MKLTIEGKTVDMKLTAEDITKVVIEVSEKYRKSMGGIPSSNWKDAKGVVDRYIKNDLTPEEDHNDWMVKGINSGWSYGKEINVESKKHSLLLPFEKLSPEHQILEHMVYSIVKVLKEV